MDSQTLRGALLVTAIGLLSATSCGSDGSLADGTDSRIEDPNHGCISCSADPAQNGLDTTYSQSAQLLVEPEELMFYGEIVANRSADPQDVVITNHTNATIMLTTATVTDNPEVISGNGAAQYFNVSELPDNAILAPEQSLTLHVSFLRSMQQRSAILWLGTSHPSFPSIGVSLTGKYFQ